MTSYPTVGSNSQNLLSIAEYLEAQGFSQAGAAGVAGTISGESGGDPESVGSGGNGLIGWTPPLPGIVTGNRQQDFDKQLVDLMQYANANSAEAVARGGVNLTALMHATDPLQAGVWWSEFEGPKQPGSDERNATTQQIFNELNGYKANSGYTLSGASLTSATSSGSGSGSGSTCLGITLPSWLGGNCLGQSVPSIGTIEGDLKGWAERAGLWILGGIFIIIGTWLLFKDSDAGKAAASTAKGAAKTALEAAPLAVAA